MATNRPQQDPEDARTDLLAALAASRDLGPEMDKALVDSYMEKHNALIRPAAQPVAQPRAQSGEFLSFMCMGLGIVAFIAVLAVSHGSLWWMFWPLIGWAGWRWGWGSGGGSNGGEYRSAREDYRRARWEYRMQRRAARFGVPYTSGYDQPQAVPPPQYPQPRYPQSPASPEQPPSDGGTSQPSRHAMD